MDTHNVTNTHSIPFSPPDMTELEAKYASDAILSGWITTGPRTKQLEKLIAEYTGAACCACLNSATAALELALRVLGIGPGDEVIVPVYTYTASASVVEHVGAKLVLIDSTEDGVEMDYGALERAINERTKAVIPVDLGGVPCDYERIFKAVESKRDVFRPANPLQSALNRAAVIADGAHALGAKLLFGGRLMPVGSVADFTAFSFHAVKNFTTAEGGALVWKQLPGTDDSVIYKQIQLFSLHGQNKDALAKTKLGAWEYDIIAPWYKCNMTDISAAVGLKQLDRYEGLLARRKEIILRYDEALDSMGLLHLEHYSDVHTGSGHLYAARIPGADDEKRREIIQKMAEKGVSTNVHYKPLPMMTAYKSCANVAGGGADIHDYPNAYHLYENEITLPLHTKLTDEDAEYVIAALKEAVV